MLNCTRNLFLLAYLLVVLLGMSARVSAQSVLYGIPTISGGPPGSIIRINLVTCEVTVLASNLPVGNFTDFVLMPNGNIYLLGFSGNVPAKK